MLGEKKKVVSKVYVLYHSICTVFSKVQGYEKDQWLSRVHCGGGGMNRNG